MSTPAVHFESATWPEASLYVDEVEVEQNGQKTTGGKIRSIMLMDESIHGTWMPHLTTRR